MNIYFNPFLIFTPALNELIFEQQKEQIDISEKLAAHQIVEKWKYRQASITVHAWSQSMLVFFFEGVVAYPAICFRKNRLGNLGHYKPSVNAFGLENEINLNSLHLGRSSWEVAATLLHEIAHLFCHLNGLHEKGNCHNRAFRKLMKSFGINVDRKGRRIGKFEPGSLFEKWCVSNKVGNEPFFSEEPVRFSEQGIGSGSKLKKYTCACGYNVRVARQGFSARCNNCYTDFKLNDSTR